MRETWFSHNTDKLLLLCVLMVMWFTVLPFAAHIFHHDIDNMGAIAFISFMTGSVSTVLGALILILTGRVQRADSTPSPIPPSPDAPKQP